MCKQIDHFPEDADYEADASEYFLRESFILHPDLLCCCMFTSICYIQYFLFPSVIQVKEKKERERLGKFGQGESSLKVEEEDRRTGMRSWRWRREGGDKAV